MRAILRVLAGHRDLRLVLSAGLVSMVGDWILRIGLVYHVFVLTNSTVVSAILMLSSFVPQLLLGSVAGVFVDRWDRRRTMVVTNLLLAVGLLPLLLVHDASRVWVVFIVLFYESSVAQFFVPAEQVERLADVCIEAQQRRGNATVADDQRGDALADLGRHVGLGETDQIVVRVNVDESWRHRETGHVEHTIRGDLRHVADSDDGVTAQCHVGGESWRAAAIDHAAPLQDHIGAQNVVCHLESAQKKVFRPPMTV